MPRRGELPRRRTLLHRTGAGPGPCGRHRGREHEPLCRAPRVGRPGAPRARRGDRRRSAPRRRHRRRRIQCRRARRAFPAPGTEVQGICGRSAAVDALRLQADRIDTMVTELAAAAAPSVPTYEGSVAETLMAARGAVVDAARVLREHKVEPGSPAASRKRACEQVGAVARRRPRRDARSPDRRDTRRVRRTRTRPRHVAVLADRRRRHPRRHPVPTRNSRRDVSHTRGRRPLRRRRSPLGSGRRSGTEVERAAGRQPVRLQVPGRALCAQAPAGTERSCLPRRDGHRAARTHHGRGRAHARVVHVVGRHARDSRPLRELRRLRGAAPG